MESITDYCENVVNILFSLSDHRQVDHVDGIAVAAWTQDDARIELPLNDCQVPENHGQTHLEDNFSGKMALPCFCWSAKRVWLALSDGASCEACLNSPFVDLTKVRHGARYRLLRERRSRSPRALQRPSNSPFGPGHRDPRMVPRQCSRRTSARLVSIFLTVTHMQTYIEFL